MKTLAMTLTVFAKNVMAENHAWIMLLANANDYDVGWGYTNFIHE